MTNESCNTEHDIIHCGRNYAKPTANITEEETAHITPCHWHPPSPRHPGHKSGCNLVKYSPCPLLVSEFKAPEDDTYDRPESPRSVSFLGELRQKSHNDLENIKVMNFVSNLRLKKVNVKEIWINNRNKYLFSLACWCQSGQYKVWLCSL